MENKQTAVEWLIEVYSFNEFISDYNFEKAKQMEKEQIEESFNNSSWFIDGKEYYDKTYGN
jgi:hypothetical protein